MVEIMKQLSDFLFNVSCMCFHHTISQVFRDKSGERCSPSRSIKSSASPRVVDNSDTAADAPCELSRNAKPELGSAADVSKPDALVSGRFFASRINVFILG